MDKPASVSSPISGLLLAGLVITLSFSTAYSYNRASILNKQNAALREEVNKVTASFSTFEEENQKLASKIEAVEAERDNLKQAVEGFQSETSSLRNELQKISDSLGSAKEEKTYLEEILISKAKEIETIKKNYSAPVVTLPNEISVPTFAAETADTMQKLKQKDEEIRKLTDQNRVLSQKLERIYKTTNEKISEINVAKITLEETITEARKIIDTEWSAVDLGAIAVETKGSSKNSQQAPKPRQAKREGRILAINEDHGFVVVDLGKMDNIDNGTVLSLKKNGREIGKLSVLEVRDVMTACNIQTLNQGMKIEVNDPVLVQ